MWQISFVPISLSLNYCFYFDTKCRSFQNSTAKIIANALSLVIILMVQSKLDLVLPKP